MAAVSNQFGALGLGDDNDGKRGEDEELSFGKLIAEAVEAAINSDTGKRREETRAQKKARQAKGTPRAATPEGAITGDLVATMIAALQPVLVKSVTAAVTAAVAVASKQIMIDLRHDLEEVQHMREEVQSLRARVQTQSFELDRLQQYSRRDNIRVYGIEEKPDECTNTIIVKLAHDMGVEIEEQELSVSHRLGRKTGKPRPIIAKFVRRDTKSKMMRAKKELRGVSGYRQVFLNDDLTTLRSRLVYELKRDESIKSVWTIDGRIMCVREEGGKDVKSVIDSPDDLFKVGWSEEKVAGLGVYRTQ